MPRKAETFQKDLYPATASAEPAMTAEEWASGKNKPPMMMDLSPGAQGNGGGQVEFKLSQNRISTLLSAPSNQSSRPQSQIQQNGNSGNGGAQSPVVVNALPEGLNIEELLEDIKKLKATVRKQGRRIAKLEQAKEESG